MFSLLCLLNGHTQYYLTAGNSIKVLYRIWYPFALCFAPHAPDKTQKKAKEAKIRRREREIKREGSLGFRLLLIVATICDNDLGCQFLMSQFVYCLWRPLAADPRYWTRPPTASPFQQQQQQQRMLGVTIVTFYSVILLPFAVVIAI